ncbi:MAG: hypothetical protein H7Z41_09605, partial [Cytophagales bacterium]|nr:hypothetical protein [Armatimonadota bacterium]
SVSGTEDSLLNPGNGYDPAPITPSSVRLSQSNDNAFYRANVSFPPKAIYWAKDGGNIVTSYTTVADFLSMQAATPQGTYDYESRSHETISGVDPFFVNPGTEDYRLKNGSANPAFDRGQSLPTDIVDAFNAALPTARPWSPNQPGDPLLIGTVVDQGAIQRN